MVNIFSQSQGSYLGFDKESHKQRLFPEYEGGDDQEKHETQELVDKSLDEGYETYETDHIGPLKVFKELNQKSILNVNRNMYLMSRRVSYVTLVDHAKFNVMRPRSKSRDDTRLIRRQDSLAQARLMGK